jgi:hypothetical protein
VHNDIKNIYYFSSIECHNCKQSFGSIVESFNLNIYIIFYILNILISMMDINMTEMGDLITPAFCNFLMTTQGKQEWTTQRNWQNAILDINIIHSKYRS